ncbi:MAG: TonB-dependent receptor plug domain-containing protein [Bacteroidales bacterium]|nr:TonB-dependent receptor plug domain-containing protein [Bacteroidales bacterium]
MRLKGCIFLILLSAPWCVKAQEADSLEAARVFAVQQFPVTKAIEEVSVNSLVAPPMQVAEVLRRFTGVQVKDYGGAGGLKTVNIRSLGSEHVGVFLDGIQIDNAQNMQVDLGRFSVDNLETVSLYNAQKSLRLQTAKEYAAGATVYLRTAAPRHDALSVRLRAGSFGTASPSVRWDKRLGAVMLRTSADFTVSNGKYKYPCFDTTLVRENGDICSLRLEAQVFGKTQDGEWRLHLYNYGSERGFPGPVIRRAQGFPFSAERQADQDLFVQGSWNQDWNQRYATAIRFKYANNYTHYNTHPERNPMALPYDLHYRQQSAYLSLAQSYVLSNPWSVDLSADFQHNALNSDVGQFVRPRRNTLTVAAATRLVWPSFRLAAHVVYQGAWDRYDAQQAGGWTRENAYRDTWMPSLTAYYAPFRWMETDAYVKRSYRLPSFNDLYYSLMGNSRLEPESAFQTGLNLHFKGNTGPWSGSFHLSPYYNKVSNKIVAIPTSSQFRWTMLNIGLVDITGCDVKGEGHFARGDWRVSAAIRYSFQQALDHSTKGSQTWGNQIPYIPLHSGSADLQLDWKAWTLAWNTSLCGERWSRSANTDDYHLAPWSLSDASLSYRWRGLRTGLHLRNLFNKAYQVVQGYPMPGFNWMLSVEYNW